MAPTRPSAELRPAGAGPRRSARIQAARDSKVASNATKTPTTTEGVTKSTAKAKTARYDCTTCDRNLAASAFPKYLPTDNCDHMINTCKACLKQWISMQLANNTYDKIACPECPQTMQNADVQLHANKQDYQRYDELERKHISESIPGWRWCLNPKCKAGQVHQPLLSTDKPSSTPTSRKSKRIRPNPPADESTNPDNIFTCTTCSARACIPCDRPYHDDETCEQYQARLASQDETATLKLIEKQCKRCPKCAKNIEKNGGCDHMQCTQCRTRFCWHCLVTYDVINAKGHGVGCVYALPGRVDPHAANAAAGMGWMPGGALLQPGGGGVGGNAPAQGGFGARMVGLAAMVANGIVDGHAGARQE